MNIQILKRVFKAVKYFGVIGCVFFSSCATTSYEARNVKWLGNQEAPKWLKKTIIPEEKFIYSVGHSQPKPTEQEAKDDALANATAEFVRYCKVDVQAFTRSIEVYSKAQGKEFSKLDIQAQNLIRAKAFVSRAIPEDWYIRKEKKQYLASVLLKVPKEEFDRIVSEKDIKLSLDVLFYYEDENGKMQILDEGSVLKSGDGYAIYVKPSDTCYLYVYQVDALNKAFRLFPNTEYNTGTNPIPPASETWIPNPNQVLFLDETTGGREYFYIFASSDKISEFEGENAVNVTKSYLEQTIADKKMGPAGVREKRDKEKVIPPRQSLNLVEVAKKLQAKGDFVYKTWFYHK